MFECQKTYKVEYAHQLFNSYTSLCHETIHGHSGKIQITFRNVDNNNLLDENDMVIDFGKISKLIKDHIMKKYDHALFLPKQFPRCYLKMIYAYNKRLTITDFNPTAEMFAMWICNEVNKILSKKCKKIQAVEVKFWETETGCAVYRTSSY